MEILFTWHALKRMRERAIFESEVYEVFESPVLVREGRAAVVLGRTKAGRYLTLVFDMKTRKLVTLWPASRAERRAYRGHFGP